MFSWSHETVYLPVNESFLVLSETFCPAYLEKWKQMILGLGFYYKYTIFFNHYTSTVFFL